MKQCNIFPFWEKLTDEEVPVLVKTLDALSDFFKGYGKGSK